MERHTHEHPIRTNPINPDIMPNRGDSKYTPVSGGFERRAHDLMRHQKMLYPVTRIEGADYEAAA